MTLCTHSTQRIGTFDIVERHLSKLQLFDTLFSNYCIPSPLGGHIHVHVYTDLVVP